MTAGPTGSRWALWLPLGLFAGFVAVVLFSLLKPADRAVKSAMIGRPLPQFTLAAASAAQPGLARADLADGKVHLLNIFASWCVPCAVEGPQLQADRKSVV